MRSYEQSRKDANKEHSQRLSSGYGQGRREGYMMQSRLQAAVIVVTIQDLGIGEFACTLGPKLRSGLKKVAKVDQVLHRLRLLCTAL